MVLRNAFQHAVTRKNLKALIDSRKLLLQAIADTDVRDRLLRVYRGRPME
jgi:hypothetical protein